MATWPSETVYVDDAVVQVYASGDPAHPPVVFLHGWGLSPRSYRPVVDAIAARGYRAIAPALPGFGGSDPISDPGHDTLLRLSERVAATLEAYAVPLPVPIVGHSLGAGLAVTMTAIDPDLAASLVLVCPIGGAGNALTTWLTLIGGLRHEIGNRPFARTADVLPGMLRHPRATAVSAIAAKQADLTEVIRLVAQRGVPIEIITADRDGIVPTDRMIRMLEVHLEQVPGTHGWLLTDPERCADLADEFIRGLPITPQ